MSEILETDRLAFDRLLVWLDPDRDAAGRKYEAIRARLIKVLSYRGCREAEEIADEQRVHAFRSARDGTAGQHGRAKQKTDSHTGACVPGGLDERRPCGG